MTIRQYVWWGWHKAAFRFGHFRGGWSIMLGPLEIRGWVYPCPETPSDSTQ